MLLYGITICMGVLSLVLVHARDDMAALVLLLVGAAVIFGMRKLGYLEHLAGDNLIGWFRDIADELGLQQNRRAFLGWQVAISQSSNLEEMWDQTVSAARFLGLDYVELDIFGHCGTSPYHQPCLLELVERKLDSGASDINQSLHISLPLTAKGHALGFLVLAKDIVSSPLSPFTLRRIEQLRRTVQETLVKVASRDLSKMPKLNETHNLNLRSNLLSSPHDLNDQRSKLAVH